MCRRLKVAIFSTGDELREPGQPLENGQIYDSNRLTIRLMLEKLGCEILDLGIIADDPQALRNAFHQADNNADLVITSGGVSVGEADYTKEILDATGDIGFGSWPLSRANPLPLVVYSTLGSVVYRAIRYLRRLPSINWCNR